MTDAHSMTATPIYSSDEIRRVTFINTIGSDENCLKKSNEIKILHCLIS